MRHVRIDDAHYFVETAFDFVARLVAETPEADRGPDPTRQRRNLGSEAACAAGIDDLSKTW